MTIKNETGIPSGKDIAKLQGQKASLLNEVESMHNEVRFLESVRGKLQTSLVEEEGEQLRVVRLTAEEYQRLIGFIPRLKNQIQDLEIEKKNLDASIPILRSEFSDLAIKAKKEKDILDRVRKNIIEEQSSAKEIKEIKTKELDLLYEKLRGAHEDIAMIRSEKETIMKSLEEARFKIDQYRDFVVRKARDVMRMWRQVERRWRELFPDREPAFKDDRPLTDDSEAFANEMVQSTEGVNINKDK